MNADFESPIACIHYAKNLNEGAFRETMKSLVETTFPTLCERIQTSRRDDNGSDVIIHFCMALEISSVGLRLQNIKDTFSCLNWTVIP